MCLVTQLCLTLCDHKDYSLPGSSCPWDSPGKNTGVGCHALLQGNLPDTEIESMSLMSTCIDKQVLPTKNGSNYSVRAELNLSSQIPTLCLLGSLEDRRGPYGQEDRE